MKVSRESTLFSKLSKYGNSGLFSYAQDETKVIPLEIWNKVSRYDLKHSYIQLPWNGFQELIMLTEQGKLWKFPIDNEIGMKEKNVPFEEHVFLDEYIEGFPKDTQAFMGFVVSGLANNHWMTAERKREIIKFYKQYFEKK